MKSKNNKNHEVEAPEKDGIAAIREILMGEQIAEFKASLADHSKRMAESGQSFGEDLKVLETQMDKRLDALEKSMNKQFEKLQKLLEQNVDKLNNRIDQVSEADKKNLASMLASLSQNLAKGDL